ncbi:MAG: hypothetical protein J7L23_00600 [Candidatus Diapherotrites archaeon]|nr:hypothetical protein [Candidatus Diapherotrites archaeon]
MCKLVLDSKLVRALSALGGRNLVKTTEILAGSLAAFMDGKLSSDGSEVHIILPKKDIVFKPKQGKPVFDGKYYVYQQGEVVVLSKEKTLEQIKQLLFEIASERKQYLLSRYTSEDIERYGISTDYVLKLDDEVKKLKIET